MIPIHFSAGGPLGFRKPSLESLVRARQSRGIRDNHAALSTRGDAIASLTSSDAPSALGSHETGMEL